jgi:hypothetical protein
MKNITTTSVVFVLGLMLVAGLLHGQGVTVPRTPSPAATVSQTIGISTVTINYSRPSVRGREVFGSALVPYGWNVQAFGLANSAPWRAGANENTVIEFSHPAKVEGKDVPAGKYGLFLVINKDNTGEVILSKDYRSWGSFFYIERNDQMRAPIKIRDNAMTEMLTYDFINLDKTSGELVLNWEKKQFPVKIEFAVDEIVMANAAEQLKSTVGFSWTGFNSAANYALQNKINLEQGLKWSEQAVTANPSFQTLQVKAGLLTALNRGTEADKIMKEAVAVAKENDLNLYGYQLLGTNDFDKAIEILALATTRYPNSANAWDSLGEAYALKGDSKNAIRNFKKSLTLNPPAGTKANSEKYLKQFGAL